MQKLISIFTAAFALMAVALLPEWIGRSVHATASRSRAQTKATADLSVTKTGTPNPAPAGADIVYTIVVTNNGPEVAPGVIFNDLPSAVTAFVSIDAPGWTTQTPPVGFTGNISGRNPAIQPGASSTITITMRTNANLPVGSLFSNVVNVGGDLTDPNPNNNAATQTTAVSGATGRADLAVSITDIPDPVASGQRLSYTITVNNLGPNVANDVSITTSHPANTTLASVTSNGSKCTAPAAGLSGSISCNFTAIPVNGSASITVTVNVIAASGSTLTESGSVTSGTPDPNMGNNSASTTTTVQGGGLVRLRWTQPVPSAANPAPAPTGLVVLGGGSTPGTESENLSEQESPLDVTGPCTLVRVNIYKSESTPVQTTPANRWASVPPNQLESTMAVAPAGSFYVITNVWNCNGTEVESGGSNEAGVPAGPTFDRIKIKPSGKMKIFGNGFTDPTMVFINGVAFSRAAVFTDSTFIVQKGSLVDGRISLDVLLPGVPAVVSAQTSNGGIGSTTFTLPTQFSSVTTGGLTSQDSQSSTNKKEGSHASPFARGVGAAHGGR